MPTNQRNNMHGLAKSLSPIVKKTLRFVLELIGLLVSIFIKPRRAQVPFINDKLLIKSATQLSNEIKAGKLKSEKLVESYIAQIKLVDPIINAVVDEHYDSAIKRAREIDKQLAIERTNPTDTNNNLLLNSPLVGVPFSVKETIGLKGASFTAGYAARASKQAHENNPSVQKLIDSGLVPIVSTNTPCMNLWFDSYNLLHGRTLNPYDLSRIPGGSSGGEAALLAAAGSVLGVGSDLAGSIRIPCNFCGVFGHKPTPFTFSLKGSFPVTSGKQDALRAIGPMTRYSIDLAPMLKLMVDENSLGRLRLDEQVDLSKIKLFYCDDIGDPLTSKCHRDVCSSIQAAVQHLESSFKLKATKVYLEEFKYGLPLWSAETEGGRVYVPEHPDGFIKFNPFVELFKCIIGTSDLPLNAIVCGLVEKFGCKLGSDKHKHLCAKGERLRRRFNELVGDEGVLLMPCHPEPAPHHETTIFKFLNCSYTAVGNTLHAPITQCPLGMSREGLPIGVQIIARPFNDRYTIALARELEGAFGGWIPPSKVSL